MTQQTAYKVKCWEKWPTNTAGADWGKKTTPTGWDICLHEVQTDMSWTLEQIMKVLWLLRKISA